MKEWYQYRAEESEFLAARLNSFLWLLVWEKYRDLLYAPFKYDPKDWKYIEGGLNDEINKRDIPPR